jgi:hypothetical protein
MLSVAQARALLLAMLKLWVLLLDIIIIIDTTAQSRALASLSWQVYYDVGYQPHDQPGLVILIQPPETSSGGATIHI